MANTSSARFTTVFSDAQKDAVLRSVLVEGRTVADTIRMARAGQLGLPAYNIGRYAYQIVRQGRDTFEAENDEALENAVQAELKALEIAAVAHSRAVRKKLKADGTDDPEALRKAAHGLSGARKARREAQTSAKAKPQSQTTTHNNGTASEKPNADVLTSLLGKTGARTGSLSHARNEPSSAAEPSAA